MTDGLESLPERVGRIEQKLDAVDARFDAVDARFERLEGKIDQILVQTTPRRSPRTKNH